jgi:hypothetical protein
MPSSSIQEPARLRRQLVEAAAEHLVRQPVRDRDVANVTSMYSTAWPARCAVFTGRWCWCSSAIVRISVRYFT